MKKENNRNLSIAFTVAAAGMICGCCILGGCDRSEQESLAPGSGTPAAFSIRLEGIPEYNAPRTGTRSGGSGGPLIAEWVKVNSFDVTRPVEADEEEAMPANARPRIALMELREDTVSVRPGTRSAMDTGIYFRVMAFRKTSTGYVFQSAADYTSNGSTEPTLTRGSMYLPIGGTYKFAAYSFNNATALTEALPTTAADCVWNTTAIPIPDMKNDFITFVSQDIRATEEALVLSVRFTHRLCRLTVKIESRGYLVNTFSNCTGVYIEQGGASSSWKIGAAEVSAEPGNSPPFDIPDNSTATYTHLVPFAAARPITVHFETLQLSGITNANMTDIISSTPIKLEVGKSYTITARFMKRPGIRVPANLNNLGTTCTQQDKDDLSLLTWADGNLMSTDDSKPYDWAPTQVDFGYYYPWNSTFVSEGSQVINGIDPCSKLNAAIYGSDWRTPSINEFIKLSRCTDLARVVINGEPGMFFMNNPDGLFLPFAGYVIGSGTTPQKFQSQYGFYWSSDALDDESGRDMIISSGSASTSRTNEYFKTCGFSIRCVKGTKQ